MSSCYLLLFLDLREVFMMEGCKIERAIASVTGSESKIYEDYELRHEVESLPQDG